MAEFVKFVPSKRARGGSSKAHATIHIRENGGQLRLLAAGMDFLEDCGVRFAAGDRIDVFRDVESGVLAVQRNEDDGEFALRSVSTERPGLCVNAKSLRELVGETKQYKMTRGQKGFAFFLTPI